MNRDMEETLNDRILDLTAENIRLHIEVKELRENQISLASDIIKNNLPISNTGLLKNNQVKICSSDGYLLINIITGNVEDRIIYGKDFSFYLDDDSELLNIFKVDIVEYLSYYNVSELPDEIDILDVNYAYKKNGKIKKEIASNEWRIETAELRKAS